MYSAVAEVRRKLEKRDSRQAPISNEMGEVRPLHLVLNLKVVAQMSERLRAIL